MYLNGKNCDYEGLQYYKGNTHHIKQSDHKQIDKMSYHCKRKRQIGFSVFEYKIDIKEYLAFAKAKKPVIDWIMPMIC